ncbi:GDSL esterase/lipase At4g26790 [Vigna radiata var. radiata]|uniref:GDSL esterase/lipase At4g26790 n=1 Tax=Vigna radiata var. radiata TaxID=3916 RepID=A0A1S3VWY7_VIGRR|nr:GDSL esterase/lipase At4g26790 [Vigna radiata var. radiata]
MNLMSEIGRMGKGYAPWLLFLTQILILLHFSACKVPAVIVFGDSSVDSGNNNFIPTIARSNFEPYGRDFFNGNPTGRFSNGRIPPDFVSEAFGIKEAVPAYLDPSYTISDFATGVCFASAGTGYDNATSNVADVIPLWKEVEYYKEYQKKLRAYLGEENANEILSEALYLVSIGTNDFLENYYALTERRCEFPIVEQYEDFLIGLAENFFREIYGLGARKISLTGLPPMGCLPLERAMNIMEFHNCVEEYNNLALEFNGKLGWLVSKLNNDLPGLQMIDANVYDIFLQIVKNPSGFGFEEAKTGCCGTGRFEMGFLCDPKFTCQDANKYVFWDAFHPSQKTSQIISNYLIEKHLAMFL